MSSSAQTAALAAVAQPTLYIDGKWVGSSTCETRPTINPYNGSELAQVDEACAADAERAIASARHFFDTHEWADHTRTRVASRARQLVRIAELLQEHREQLALVETLDTGKTLEEARIDVDDVTSVFRFYAEEAPKLDEPRRVQGEGIPESARSIITHEPVGVCVLITPWNYVSCSAALHGAWTR